MTRPVPLPGQARLNRCREEAQFWRNFALLLPWAVRVDRPPVVQIPAPRRPIEQRPAPRGLPPTPRIGLPRRPR